MRYKVDLKRFMADCEANYARTLRIFPGHRRLDHRRFALGEPPRHFSIRVLERSPYTSLLEISQSVDDGVPWVRFPTLKIRLYHDAQLAEVVSVARSRNMRPRYDYPNGDMHQPDEKAQWNRFLAEWLAAVLRDGYAIGQPFAFAE